MVAMTTRTPMDAMNLGELNIHQQLPYHRMMLIQTNKSILGKWVVRQQFVLHN